MLCFAAECCALLWCDVMWCDLFSYYQQLPVRELCRMSRNWNRGCFKKSCLICFKVRYVFVQLHIWCYLYADTWEIFL